MLTLLFLYIIAILHSRKQIKVNPDARCNKSALISKTACFRLMVLNDDVIKHMMMSLLLLQPSIFRNYFAIQKSTTKLNKLDKLNCKHVFKHTPSEYMCIFFLIYTGHTENTWRDLQRPHSTQHHAQKKHTEWQTY